MSRSRRWVVATGAVVVVVAALSHVRAQSPGARTAATPPNPVQASTTVSERRQLLDSYCVRCHNERLKTAGFSLERADVDHPERDAETWEKVLFKLRSAQMPPAGAPQPDAVHVRAFRAAVEADLDRAALAQPNPGRVAVHRLNRAEYVNAVRDLLSLEVDAAAFLPADEADREGFDNSASGLSVSPALVERYLSAATRVSRLAIGEAPSIAGFDTFKVPLRLFQEARIDQDLPFGSRGGMAVSYRFPVDADYLIKLRLRRQIYDYITGMGTRQMLDVRIDGVLVKRFEIGGEDRGMPGPHTWIGQVVGDPEWEAYMHHADDGFEVRVPVRAGTRVVGISFVNNFGVGEGVVQPPQRGFGAVNDEEYDGRAAIDTVVIGGPYAPRGPGETASRQRVFVCTPTRPTEETACASTILSTLARRAYRRPVLDRDLQPLMAAYRDGRRRGSRFDAGVQAGLERILVSPDFLYRIERDPAGVRAGAAVPITDLELASRLSFFLWSSIPDDELLDVAARGTLHEPAMLERQVRRMLQDPRAQALVDNFVGQWLELRKVRAIAPDLNAFSTWDENLRAAFEEETRLFVASQIRDDRNVLDLLSADYTFLNERLAMHYGVPGIHGERFRRVQFTDGTRGGLLGQASLLAVTSYPNRTSPVLRGKWVLDNILGMPPPPPPPDVPALEESGTGALASVRARMEQHRRSPACAVCHVRMDPIGFAMENFDGIGAWRTVSDGMRIDTSGAFPDGTRFDGVAGLRAMLLTHREDFVMTLTAKLLTYAIGRPLEYFDRPVIRSVVRDATARGEHWTSIILGVVQSTSFRMRRADS